MISVEGLTVEFGGFTLFDDVSFVVNKKDRIALVGKNGAGKSTMLKIFSGLQSPTSGSISVPKETDDRLSSPAVKLADTQTVREEAEHAFEHIHEMEKEIERLNQQLAERTDYENGIVSKPHRPCHASDGTFPDDGWKQLSCRIGADIDWSGI